VRSNSDDGQDTPQDSVQQLPIWVSSIALVLWLAAAAVAFLPFAFDTSPWDAVTLRVPGNQGNWWHFLAGAPFFLAFPAIWIRLRVLFAGRGLTRTARRFIWGVVSLSLAGTLLVELPFLLHLAGTSEWQRFIVLGLGFSIILASVLVLVLRRRHFAAAEACIAGLDAAYLANLSLCLVVYAGATGDFSSRSGWFASMGIVWPVACELLWLLGRSFGGEGSRLIPREGSRRTTAG
jgi:hypothetical protein